jgi:enoyl-CoA hydratase
MMGQYIKVEKENKCAILTITNPPLNVLNKQIFRELLDVFEQLQQDDETVAILITGAGDKAFAAGADIKEFPEMMGSSDIKQMVMNGHRALNAIDRIEKPTIAVLNGITFGGGCELALACDIRIAEEQIQMGLPEVKLGLFPGGGGTQRLSRLVGIAKAKELMFTGSAISAQEAEQIGLVNKVVQRGEGLNKARDLAATITGHSLEALSRIKQSVNQGAEMFLEDGLDLEAKLFVEIFQTEDIKEGVQAFIEKRTPAFQHR